VEGEEFLQSARHIVEEAESTIARLKTRSRGESGEGNEARRSFDLAL